MERISQNPLKKFTKSLLINLISVYRNTMDSLFFFEILKTVSVFF